jgi:hypothetical protein
VPNEPTVVTTVVTPPPEVLEPTTEPSNPLTVLIAPSPSDVGEATTADLLARVRQLEEKLALTERTAEAAMSTAMSAELTATLATPEPEPIAEATETMVIPESSDSGPPAKADPKPVEKKGFLHHWI